MANAISAEQGREGTEMQMAWVRASIRQLGGYVPPKSQDDRWMETDGRDLTGAPSGLIQPRWGGVEGRIPSPGLGCVLGAGSAVRASGRGLAGPFRHEQAVLGCCTVCEHKEKAVGRTKPSGQMYSLHRMELKFHFNFF